MLMSSGECRMEFLPDFNPVVKDQSVEISKKGRLIQQLFCRRESWGTFIKSGFSSSRGAHNNEPEVL